MRARLRGIAAEALLLSAGVRSQRGLADELRGRVDRLAFAGDADQPGPVGPAIREGIEVGRSLGSVSTPRRGGARVEIREKDRMRSETARRILGALAVVLVGLVGGWGAVTRIHRKKPRLTTEQAREYLGEYMQRMHIGGDISGLDDAWVELGDDARLHLTALPADGATKTLVFIPGTSAYSQWYIEFYLEMHRRGYNIVGFDPRGHGLSSGTRGDYTLRGIVDDAHAVTRYARERFRDPVALVGSSQGGIAAFYAAAEDDSLAAVVCDGFADMDSKTNLVLSEFRPPHWAVSPLSKALGLFRRFLIPIKLYLRLNHDFMKDGSDLETYYAKDPLWADWISIDALLSLLRTEIAKPVEQVSVPVMLLHADGDKIFPKEYVDGIYARLTAPKTYLLLRDTDHLVLVNSVPEIAPGIDEWLSVVMRRTP